MAAHGMRDLSSPTGIEPMFPVWKHDFLTTGPPGKSLMALNKTNHFSLT